MAKAETFTYDYEVLRRLTGLSRNMLYQYRRRGDLNPENLESWSSLAESFWLMM